MKQGVIGTILIIIIIFETSNQLWGRNWKLYDLLRPLNKPFALTMKDLENPRVIKSILRDLSFEIDKNPLNEFLWRLRFEYSLIFWDILPPGEKGEFARIAYAWGKKWTRLMPADPEGWLMRGLFLGAVAVSIGTLNALYFANNGKKFVEKGYILGNGLLKAFAAGLLGRLYFKLPPFPLSFGNPDKAAIFLKEAISLDPATIYYHVFLAELLAYQEKTDEALEILNAATKIKPRNWFQKVSYIWTMRTYDDLVDEVKSGLKGKYNKYTYDFLINPRRHPSLFGKQRK